jgi:hypothetical protein
MPKCFRPILSVYNYVDMIDQIVPLVNKYLKHRRNPLYISPHISQQSPLLINQVRILYRLLLVSTHIQIDQRRRLVHLDLHNQ